MKRILCAIAAFVMLICPAVHAVSTDIVWDFDSGTEGWQVNKGGKGVSLFQSGSDLVHTITVAGTTNTFILSPNNLGISGNEKGYVVLRMRNDNTDAEFLALTFVTDKETAWDTTYSDASPKTVLIGGSKKGDSYVDYVFDMTGNSSWIGGTVTRMRIIVQDYSGSKAGSVYIESIKVTDSVVPRAKAKLTLSGGAVYQEGTSVRLKASAENVEEITAADFYVNGSLVGSDNSGAPYQTLYKFTERGRHSFHVVLHREDGTELVSDRTDINVTGWERTYGMIFGFDGTIEDFQVKSDRAELAPGEEACEFNLTSGNAYMTKTGLEVNGGENQYLKVRMKNLTSSESVCIQWVTKEDNVWTEDNKITFSEDCLGSSVTADDEDFKEYVFYLGSYSNWADKSIAILQFYPAKTASGGTVYIDEISFTNMAGEGQEPGSLRIYSEQASAVIPPKSKAEITAELSDEDSARRVEYYIGKTKIGETDEAPYSISYIPQEEGETEISAVFYDSFGRMIEAENTVKIVCRSDYDFSPPVYTDTETKREFSFEIKKNTTKDEIMIIVAGLFDENGRLTAIRSCEADFEEAAKISFPLADCENAEKAVFAVWRGLVDTRCYTTPYTVNFEK